MPKTFNSSGVGGANCEWLIGLDNDASNGNLTEFVGLGTTFTPDNSGSQANTSGSYGWGFTLDFSGTNFTNYGFGVSPTLPFNAGSGHAWTLFIAFNGIASPGVTHGTVYFLSQSTSVIGSALPDIVINSTVGAYTPSMVSGSTAEANGTSAGSATAFWVAISGGYGNSSPNDNWQIYQGSSTPAGSATVSNTGSNISLARIGGVNGQGSFGGTCGLAYVAKFNTILSGADIASLGSSLTGSGAFSLITLPGSGGPPPSQFFLDAPLAGLAAIIGRREKIRRQGHDLKIERSWRQDKQSRIFLPEYKRAA